jgi:hypothetical protein
LRQAYILLCPTRTPLLRSRSSRVTLLPQPSCPQGSIPAPIATWGFFRSNFSSLAAGIVRHPTALVLADATITNLLESDYQPTPTVQTGPLSGTNTALVHHPLPSTYLNQRGNSDHRCLLSPLCSKIQATSFGQNITDGCGRQEGCDVASRPSRHHQLADPSAQPPPKSLATATATSYKLSHCLIQFFRKHSPLYEPDVASSPPSHTYSHYTTRPLLKTVAFVSRPFSIPHIVITRCSRV